MKRRFSAAIAAVLAAATLTGCGMGASDLMAGIRPSTSRQTVTDVGGEAVCDFAVRLFRESFDGENAAMISPLSVLAALAMTANGARGETLAQMEAALGMKIEQLNAWFAAYEAALPEAEKYKLSLANSIWFTDDESFTVMPGFLQTNADYYGAGIYRAPFDDGTCRDINSWVKEHTDGMIKKILDKIPDEAVMYLVNALAFDAEWQTIYKENQVRPGTFTALDGSERKTDMMYSTESRYLSDDDAEGFIKYYADGKYAFAALLPEEGTDIAEYAASLTGEGLYRMLTNPDKITVEAAIPRFEMEYDIEMRAVLEAMGMVDAFDGDLADFSGLGSSTQGNLCISRVLHKTYLAVDEKGTKAGAATVVEVVCETAAEVVGDVKRVYLDRPFLCMLVDCETMLPFFIGAVTDIAA